MVLIGRRAIATTVARSAVVAVVAVVAISCGPSPAIPSPASPSADYAVVARWAADDGSVVALNVVIGSAVDRGRLADAARELGRQHPRSRLIVTFFAPWAGPERYVIGHVPMGDRPMPVSSRAPSWLWTVDLRPLAPRAT